MLAMPVVALVLTGLAMVAFMFVEASGILVPAPELVTAALIGLLAVEAVAAVACIFLYVMAHENFAMDSRGAGIVSRLRCQKRRYRPRRSQRARHREAQTTQHDEASPPAEPKAQTAEASSDAPTASRPPGPAAQPQPDIHRADVHHAEGLRVPESMVVDDREAVES
jgi:hypothetical protein